MARTCQYDDSPKSESRLPDRRNLLLCGTTAAYLLCALGTTSLAQQTTGTPGSPGATTTIDGRYRPPPLAYNSNSGLGRSGTGTLMVDDKAVSPQKMENTVPLGLSLDAMFDVGSKTNTPIDPQDYQIPFVFTGKIDKVTISVSGVDGSG